MVKVDLSSRLMNASLVGIAQDYSSTTGEVCSLFSFISSLVYCVVVVFFANSDLFSEKRDKVE